MYIIHVCAKCNAYISVDQCVYGQARVIKPYFLAKAILLPICPRFRKRKKVLRLALGIFGINSTSLKNFFSPLVF